MARYRGGSGKIPKESDPLVSIGLPVYNGENYLEEAIRSILAQTYTHFELIISDNGSTDRTQEICEFYAERDLRIRYYRNKENLGAAWNYNQTFHLAKGKYFKWAAHDDMIEEEFLSECVAYLERNDDVSICYTYTRIINKIVNDDFVHISKTIITEDNAYDRIKEFLPLHLENCHAVFGVIRSDMLRKTNLILPYPRSDNLLLFELAVYGKIHQINRPLFVRRVHPLCSIPANQDLADLNKWFDPNSNKQVFLFSVRFPYERAKAVFTSDIKPIHRIKGLCYILCLFIYHYKDVYRELNGYYGSVRRVHKVYSAIKSYRQESKKMDQSEYQNV